MNRFSSYFKTKVVVMRLLFVIGLVFYIMLSGCSNLSDELVDLVNSKWPPVSIEERKYYVIKKSQENLKGFDQAHVAVSIQSGVVIDVLKKQLSNVAPQLNKVDFSFGKQLIKIEAEYSDLVPIQDFSVNVKAIIVGFVSIGVDGTDLIVSPVFESIKVKSLEVNDNLELEKAANVIAAFLDNFIDNINGNIQELQPQRFSLVPNNPSSIEQEPGSIEQLFLNQLVVLIDEYGLHAMVQLAINSIDVDDSVFDKDVASTTKKSGTIFRSFKNEFESKRMIKFGKIDKTKEVWVKVAPDAISDLLTNRYKPVSDLHIRFSAVKAAAKQMEMIGSPNAMGYIGSDFLREYLEDELNKIAENQKNLGLSDFSIGFANQAINLNASYEFKDEKKSFSVNGSISGFVSLGASGHSISFFPHLTSLKVNNINAGEESLVDLRLTVDTINSVLEQLLATANSVLNNNRPSPVELALDPFSPIDIGKSLANTKGLTILTNKIIQPIINISIATVLVSPKGLWIPLSVSNKAEENILKDLPEDVIPVDVSEKDFQELFLSFSNTVQIAAEKYIPKEQAYPVAWIGLKRKLIADVINDNMNQLGVCATYDLSLIPESPIDSIVGSDKHKEIDCSSNRDCTPSFTCTQSVDNRDCTPHSCSQNYDRRDCTPHSCSQSRDTRNCHACLLRAPRVCAFGHCEGGHCIQYGNDPICEASKAGQNAIYRTEYLACQADAARLKGQCEAAKAAQNAAYRTEYLACQADAARLKGQCEAAKTTQNALYLTEYKGCEANRKVLRAECDAEKALEKATCESYKEAVKQVSDYGRVKGKLNTSGKPTLCINKIVVSEDLSSVEVVGGLKGAAEVKADIKYTPHNLVGHLACVSPWRGPINANVRLVDHQLALTGAITSTSEGEVSVLELRTDQQELAVKMDPKPLDALFINNPDAALKCSLAAIVGYTVQLADTFARLGGGKISDELNGKFKVDLDSQNHNVRIEPMKVTAGKHKLSIVPKWYNEAILFEAN